VAQHQRVVKKAELTRRQLQQIARDELLPRLTELTQVEPQLFAGDAELRRFFVEVEAQLTKAAADLAALLLVLLRLRNRTEVSLRRIRFPPGGHLIALLAVGGALGQEIAEEL